MYMRKDKMDARLEEIFMEEIIVRFTFYSEYEIGDKVKILACEHNDNWEGRIGRIAEIGIGLSQVVYLVEFRREKFKPCFKAEDLKSYLKIASATVCSLLFFIRSIA